MINSIRLLRSGRRTRRRSVREGEDKEVKSRELGLCHSLARRYEGGLQPPLSRERKRVACCPGPVSRRQGGASSGLWWRGRTREVAGKRDEEGGGSWRRRESFFLCPRKHSSPHFFPRLHGGQDHVEKQEEEEEEEGRRREEGNFDRGSFDGRILRGGAWRKRSRDSGKRRASREKNARCNEREGCGANLFTVCPATMYGWIRYEDRAKDSDEWAWRMSSFKTKTLFSSFQSPRPEVFLEELKHHDTNQSSGQKEEEEEEKERGRGDDKGGFWSGARDTGRELFPEGEREKEKTAATEALKSPVSSYRKFLRASASQIFFLSEVLQKLVIVSPSPPSDFLCQGDQAKREKEDFWGPRSLSSSRAYYPSFSSTSPAALQSEEGEQERTLRCLDSRTGREDEVVFGKRDLECKRKSRWRREEDGHFRLSLEEREMLQRAVDTAHHAVDLAPGIPVDIVDDFAYYERPSSFSSSEAFHQESPYAIVCRRYVGDLFASANSGPAEDSVCNERVWKMGEEGELGMQTKDREKRKEGRGSFFSRAGNGIPTADTEEPEEPLSSSLSPFLPLTLGDLLEREVLVRNRLGRRHGDKRSKRKVAWRNQESEFCKTNASPLSSCSSVYTALDLLEGEEQLIDVGWLAKTESRSVDPGFLGNRANENKGRSAEEEKDETGEAMARNKKKRQTYEDAENNKVQHDDTSSRCSSSSSLAREPRIGVMRVFEPLQILGYTRCMSDTLETYSLHFKDLQPRCRDVKKRSVEASSGPGNLHNFPASSFRCPSFPLLSSEPSVSLSELVSSSGEDAPVFFSKKEKKKKEVEDFMSKSISRSASPASSSSSPWECREIPGVLVENVKDFEFFLLPSGPTVQAEGQGGLSCTCFEENHSRQEEVTSHFHGLARPKKPSTHFGCLYTSVDKRTKRPHQLHRAVFCLQRQGCSSSSPSDWTVPKEKATKTKLRGPALTLLSDEVLIDLGKSWCCFSFPILGRPVSSSFDNSPAARVFSPPRSEGTPRLPHRRNQCGGPRPSFSFLERSAQRAFCFLFFVKSAGEGRDDDERRGLEVLHLFLNKSPDSSLFLIAASSRERALTWILSARAPLDQPRLLADTTPHFCIPRGRHLLVFDVSKFNRVSVCTCPLPDLSSRSCSSPLSLHSKPAVAVLSPPLLESFPPSSSSSFSSFSREEDQAETKKALSQDQASRRDSPLHQYADSKTDREADKANACASQDDEGKKKKNKNLLNLRSASRPSSSVTVKHLFTIRSFLLSDVDSNAAGLVLYGTRPPCTPSMFCVRFNEETDPPSKVVQPPPSSSSSSARSTSSSPSVSVREIVIADTRKKTFKKKTQRTVGVLQPGVNTRYSSSLLSCSFQSPFLPSLQLCLDLESGQIFSKRTQEVDLDFLLSSSRPFLSQYYPRCFQHFVAASSSSSSFSSSSWSPSPSSCSSASSPHCSSSSEPALASLRSSCAPSPSLSSLLLTKGPCSPRQATSAWPSLAEETGLIPPSSFGSSKVLFAPSRDGVCQIPITLLLPTREEEDHAEREEEEKRTENEECSHDALLISTSARSGTQSKHPFTSDSDREFQRERKRRYSSALPLSFFDLLCEKRKAATLQQAQDASPSGRYDTLCFSSSRSSPSHATRPLTVSTAEESSSTRTPLFLRGGSDFPSLRASRSSHTTSPVSPSSRSSGTPPPSASPPCRPLLLHAYGCYKRPQSLHFSAGNLVLLSLGWMVGFVHTRGEGAVEGEEKSCGRGLKKYQVLDDMEDACMHLIASHLTTRSFLFLKCVSAGGLIGGSFVSFQKLRTWFSGIVIRQGFLDVYSAMRASPGAEGQEKIAGDPAGVAGRQDEETETGEKNEAEEQTGKENTGNDAARGRCIREPGTSKQERRGEGGEPEAEEAEEEESLRELEELEWGYYGNDRGGEKDREDPGCGDSLEFQHRCNILSYSPYSNFHPAEDFLPRQVFQGGAEKEEGGEVGESLFAFSRQYLYSRWRRMLLQQRRFLQGSRTPSPLDCKQDEDEAQAECSSVSSSPLSADLASCPPRLFLVSSLGDTRVPVYHAVKFLSKCEALRRAQEKKKEKQKTRLCSLGAGEGGSEQEQATEGRSRFRRRKQEEVEGKVGRTMSLLGRLDTSRMLGARETRAARDHCDQPKTDSKTKERSREDACSAYFRLGGVEEGHAGRCSAFSQACDEAEEICFLLTVLEEKLASRLLLPRGRERKGS